MPASNWLQIKQSNFCKKSLRSTAILILLTTPYNFLWCFSQSCTNFLIISLSISTSTITESQTPTISSPRSSNMVRIGARFGRWEIDPARSPLLSKTASQVPMPFGIVSIYSVLTLWFFSFRTTSSPRADSSTIPRKVGRSSRLAISSTTFRLTPP